MSISQSLEINFGATEDTYRHNVNVKGDYSKGAKKKAKERVKNYRMR